MAQASSLKLAARDALKGSFLGDWQRWTRTERITAAVVAVVVALISLLPLLF